MRLRFVPIGLSAMVSNGRRRPRYGVLVADKYVSYDPSDRAEHTDPIPSNFKAAIKNLVVVLAIRLSQYEAFRFTLHD